MKFTVSEYIKDAILAFDKGITITTKSGYIGLIDSSLNAESDISQGEYVVDEGIIRKLGTTRLDNDVLNPENDNGPSVKYILTLRDNLAVIEMDLVINNGSLDNTKGVTPHITDDSIYITKPKGFKWVSKLELIKTQDIKVGNSVVTKITIPGAWLAQSSIFWFPLYLTSELIEDEVVESFRQNPIWLQDVEPRWLGPSKSPKGIKNPSWFSNYTNRCIGEFENWDVNVTQYNVTDEEGNTFINPFIPPSLFYLISPNGQATGGAGMGIDSLCEFYALPSSSQWLIASHALQYSLCRPQRGFFNRNGEPADIEDVEELIDKGYAKFPWQNWNVSLGGNFRIFPPNRNPFGFDEPENGWEGMIGGLGRSGSVDVQHFSRAYGPAVFLAERFDDPVGKEFIKWFAATARLDIDNPLNTIGTDEKGWYSHLGREYAFCAMINVYDYHFNGSQDARDWVLDFIKACETFQKEGMKDGNSGGSFICWRKPEISGRKEIDFGREVWASMNGISDLSKVEVIPVTQSYQEILMFAALGLAYFAGFTVEDFTFENSARFLQKATIPGSDSPEYRVNAVTAETLTKESEKGFSMGYYGCMLSYLYNLPVSEELKAAHYRDIFAQGGTVHDKLQQQNIYAIPQKELNKVALRVLTESEDFPY